MKKEWNLEKEFDYLWMLTLGFIVYAMVLTHFYSNGVYIKETNPFLFYSLQIFFWYPVIQLLIRRIKRLIYIKNEIKKNN